MKNLQGVIPIVSTPFLDDGSVDEKTFRAEINWLFSHRINGVATGMVSEAFRLTDDERTLLTRCMAEEANGRGQVVATVGAESAFQAIRHARAAEKAGAHALMAIPPALTRCTPAGLEDYYRALVESVNVPIIVQDASGYVGNSIPIALQAKLLELFPDRILFKPEAQPIGPNVTALLNATGGKARIFEGTGGIALLDSHPRGIVGTMPGPDLPWALVALWDALSANDTQRAAALHGPLAAMVSMMCNLDAFLVTEKMLLVKQGVFSREHCRGPLGFQMDEGMRTTILRLYEQLKSLV
jgi:4-hydroxy-tetrahydrodipicolinate synthase